MIIWLLPSTMRLGTRRSEQNLTASMQVMASAKVAFSIKRMG